MLSIKAEKQLVMFACELRSDPSGQAFATYPSPGAYSLLLAL